MAEYFAHSENDKKEKHLLARHLHHTAQLAEPFACCDEYRPLFRLVGLLHDSAVLGAWWPAR
jgi:hypothetical protein